MARDELLGGPAFAALDPKMMVPALALVGTLLLAAVVIAFFRRWQLSKRPLGPSPSDQLAQFRRLYEQGAISEEEFKRLRTVLGGEIRKAIDLPAKPPETPRPPGEATPPAAGPERAAEPPGEAGPAPPGIRPA